MPEGSAVVPEAGIQIRWEASEPTDPGDFRLVANSEDRKWNIPVEMTDANSFVAWDHRAAATTPRTVMYRLFHQASPGEYPA